MVFVFNLDAAEHETGNKDPRIWSPAALLDPQSLHAAAYRLSPQSTIMCPGDPVHGRRTAKARLLQVLEHEGQDAAG